MCYRAEFGQTTRTSVWGPKDFGNDAPLTHWTPENHAPTSLRYHAEFSCCKRGPQ